MRNYRIYCIDGAGHVGSAHLIEAESDEEAVLSARQLRPSADNCEIWNETRLVGRLNAEGRFEHGAAPTPAYSREEGSSLQE
jgi:hypothetical protein